MATLITPNWYGKARVVANAPRNDGCSGCGLGFDRDAQRYTVIQNITTGRHYHASCAQEFGMVITDETGPARPIVGGSGGLLARLAAR